MNKKTIISGVIGLAVAATGASLYMGAHQSPAASTMPSDTYIAAAVKGDLIQSVSCPGQVASNLDVAIKCRASGEVITLPFDISNHVKKGDLLMQLDKKDEQVVYDQARVALEQAQSRYIEAQKTSEMADLDLETATRQAAANVVSAQVKCANAKNKADRMNDLRAKNLVSQEDLETTMTDAAAAQSDLETALVAQQQLKSQAVSVEIKKEDVKLAQQQVELAQITLTNAQQQLDYTTVLSPLDGVISDLEVQKGAIISSAISNVGGGTTVMTVSDLSHIFVMASVDESDIGGVDVGQKVDITADSFPGKRFFGSVVRIATQGVNVSNVVTFQVKIEVTSRNKDLLKPLMTANVNIIEASANDVIMVPALAVVRHDRKSYVAVVDADGSNHEVAVTTGLTDGDNTQIVTGLEAGQKVVVHRNESVNRWTQQRRPIGIPGMPGGRR